MRTWASSSLWASWHPSTPLPHTGLSSVRVSCLGLPSVRASLAHGPYNTWQVFPLKSNEATIREFEGEANSGNGVPWTSARTNDIIPWEQHRGSQSSSKWQRIDGEKRKTGNELKYVDMIPFRKWRHFAKGGKVIESQQWQLEKRWLNRGKG